MNFMKCLLLVLCFLPFAAEAQMLKQNESDMQSNKKQIETYPVILKSASDIKMDVSLRAAGPTFFLQLTGSGIGANTVQMNDETIFLLDNDSTVTIRSTTVQGYDFSQMIKTYKHEYSISQEDLEVLSRHNLQALRKYSAKGFDDIYLDGKNAEEFKTLCGVFLQELNKAQLLKAIVRTAPAFPGGKEVFLSFLNRNLKVRPSFATGEKKVASIQFQVSADGSINVIQIKQSAGTSYDDELLRILKRMPKWKPALQNGKPVDSTITQQIIFYKQDTVTKVQF